MCILKIAFFFFYTFLQDKDCSVCNLETHAIFILYLCVLLCCILISYTILPVYIHPHKMVCIMALQIVILWFLYHTYAMPTMLMNYAEKGIFKRNECWLLFVAIYSEIYFKGLLWFEVHHRLIWLNITVAINVCYLCFWGTKCSLQWLNSN